MPMPVVSILMPVYNAAPFLVESINSILQQKYRDYEFLILDDASSDNSAAIIGSFADRRIRYYRNEQNLGVALTLNKGMELAVGTYIARMDADDVSVSERLGCQVEFMNRHPDIGISGGQVRLFGAGLSTIARVPLTPEEVAAYMCFENPLWHMTVIMRRSLMNANALRYNPVYTRSEDYELWTRSIRHFPIANQKRVLVRVREHGKSASRANWEVMTNQTEVIQQALLRCNGYHFTNEEIAFHHRVGRGYRMENRKDIVRAESWLARMCNTNQLSGAISNESYRQVVAMVWFRLCANSGPLGPWILKKWCRSPLASRDGQTATEVARFVASVAWHLCRRLSGAFVAKERI